MDAWPGKQMHSHNYRVPEPFQDQVVVIVGSSASAVDISRDIATVAKGVHIASRSSANQAYGKQPGYDNLWLHPMVKAYSPYIDHLMNLKANLHMKHNADWLCS